jgi:hypothetical protein
MSDLAHLEERLNSDHEYRKAFMSNPVGVLKDAGISLSEEMGRQLWHQIIDLQPASRLGDLRGVGDWHDINIGVGIEVKLKKQP